MKTLRLAEILLPLIAARAWAPWEVAPKNSQELGQLKRRVAAARLGDGSAQRLPRQWPYHDLQ
jgi:hypothetical protein